MTNEQITAVCNKYDSILEGKGVEAERHGLQRVNHIRWMCQEIPRIIETGKIEKAHRWLGFVQGALWTTNIMTIEEMKSDNR